jgi:sulfur-oxidizing protein SoxZ
MSVTAKPRIKVPDSVRVGEIIEIKTLVSHLMETGQRRDKDGKVIPRDIINTFEATFAGQKLFKARLQPGISANPYITFFLKVPGPGALELTWIDDAGRKISETLPLRVVDGG